MLSTLKTTVLLALKYSGVFRLARRLTASGLRILCYHGISVEDEHRFRGRLFMRSETFRGRMEQLRALGYPVISLDEAVRGLADGKNPSAAVVLTFDDGWKRACDEALPWLAERGIPVTLYVTSYYASRQTQVFNVAIQYLFWATRVPRFKMEVLPAVNGCELSAAADSERAQQAAIDYCSALPDAMGRQGFLLDLGDALGVDMRSLRSRGAFMLGAGDDLQHLAQAGVDLQLHTHRHTITENGASVLARELDDNRAFLEPLAEKSLTHFCYPSGVYDRGMWPEMIQSEIVSATTCESGFNYRNTPLLGLRRILDEEDLSPLEFEAELSGVLELWKKLRGKFHFVARHPHQNRKPYF